MSDPTQKEFSREVLALKDALGFTNRPAEYAGMLLGAAVVMAQEAGITKGQVITLAARIYDQGLGERAANDA